MDPFTTAALVGGGMALIGGERANAANAQQAANQMYFQERMSSSSHQREVEDLRAAGLNPILSARYGGSSTPAGAQAVMQNSMAAAAHSATDIYRSGLEGERNPSVIDLNKSSAQRQREAAYLDVEQQEVARRTAQKIGLEGTKIEADTARVIYELRHVLPSIVELNRASSVERGYMAERISFEIQKILPYESERLQSELLRINSLLEGIMSEAQIDRTDWGAFWRYVGRISSSVLGGIFK